MKLMHLADLHIGKYLNDFDLLPDQRYIFDEIVKIGEKNQIDAVLIAGDVYDKSIPPEGAVQLLNDFINRLAEKNWQVYLIPGNHDSDERLHFGADLLRSSGVFIEAKFDGRLHGRVLKKGSEKVVVYMMPFIKASQVRHFYPDEKIESYEDAVKTVIAHSDIDPEEINILVAHQFVGGSSAQPELGGSEGRAVQNVGLVEMIGHDCFDAFSYVALGHIHAPQKIGRETVRYAGSPLKYSLSEVNNEKSVPIVTVSEKGKISVELEKLHPVRDLRHLKGKMEQLLDKNNIVSPEDFIYITLTDEELIRDAMGIFQQIYPNTVKLDYDNSHTKELGETDLSAVTEERSFKDLISDFYYQMYGCEISEEEWQVMREVAGEAGVADETD